MGVGVGSYRVGVSWLSMCVRWVADDVGVTSERCYLLVYRLARLSGRATDELVAEVGHVESRAAVTRPVGRSDEREQVCVGCAADRRPITLQPASRSELHQRRH